jgi:hypothetical protein
VTGQEQMLTPENLATLGLADFRNAPFGRQRSDGPWFAWGPRVYLLLGAAVGKADGPWLQVARRQRLQLDGVHG